MFKKFEKLEQKKKKKKLLHVSMYCRIGDLEINRTKLFFDI